MKFRVLGVAAVMLGAAVSITSRAGAQAGVTGTEPKAAAPEPTAPPAEAAFPPVEESTPPALPTPAAEVAGPSARSDAPVETLPQRRPDPQAYFGFGAQVGFYNPNGFSARVGVPAISLEATVGFVPVLLDYGDSQHPELKFLMPFEVSPQLVIHAVTFRNDIRGNLLLGYRYNAALGHAPTIGGQIEKRVSRHWLIEGMWGISYYPDAADRLRGNQVAKDTDFQFPPQLGAGISIGALFYP